MHRDALQIAHGGPSPVNASQAPIDYSCMNDSGRISQIVQLSPPWACQPMES